jgi:secreted trypsin-like serine protease
VSGWGVTFEGGVTARELLMAEAPVIDLDRCQELYEGDLLSSEMCAGFEDGSFDACEGDTGTGLVHNGTLVGVAAWGNTCGQPGRPGIYSNAAKYTDWILLKLSSKK